jgi:hypothetical protein
MSLRSPHATTSRNRRRTSTITTKDDATVGRTATNDSAKVQQSIAMARHAYKHEINVSVIKSKESNIFYQMNEKKKNKKKKQKKKQKNELVFHQSSHYYLAVET